jgi:hypothetical protein
MAQQVYIARIIGWNETNCFGPSDEQMEEQRQQAQDWNFQKIKILYV